MPAQSSELRGLRILLVEDEFLVSLDLESMLQDLGGEVIGPIASLDQALLIAREEALDGAVLDVNVGGSLVTPVADALAARNIPFVFCTGYDVRNLPGRHAGAPAVMKPCRVHELRDALLGARKACGGQARASAKPGATGSERRGIAKTAADRGRRAGRRPTG